MMAQTPAWQRSTADGSPIRPETYSWGFAAHCAAAGVLIL